MSTLRSRREVLKIAGTGIAGVAAGMPAVGRRQGEPPAGDIRVRRTYGDKRWAEEPSLRWQPSRTADASAVRLDPARSYQEVLGFGASLTDAACYMISRLSPAPRAQLLRELFHPAEMALGVSRICVGSSDYATAVYSYDEGEPDPSLARFSIDRDREYVLPILLECRRLNPGLFLLASPWSPPGWMKANGSMLGGSMRKSSFRVYAQYLARFLQAYADAGVPVDAITTQNEVDTDQDGRMPACLWGQEYEIEFVARHLGPQLAAANVATKIWILDHNYNLWGRAVATLDEPGVARYVDGIAWHGYAGRPDMMSRAHDAHPEKHTYWTEGGPDYKDPGYLTNWTRWSATFAGILRNWARCVIGWNLALDEQGRPNIGPFSCGGVLTINSTTGDVTRSGMYWALAHYSRGVRRGARRVESEGGADGISHVAFRNPDGSFAVILTNAGPERAVLVQWQGATVSVSLPADSVTTLRWG